MKINPWDEYAKELKAWERKAEKKHFPLPVEIIQERYPYEWWESKAFERWMRPSTERGRR
jgi:hypothetical protein